MKNQRSAPGSDRHDVRQRCAKGRFSGRHVWHPLGRTRLVAAALVLLCGQVYGLGSQPLWAQGAGEEPGELVTDRPDQTESAEVLPRGFVQLELGWTFSHEDEGGFEADSLSVPEVLARIGLGNRFELRLGWDGIAFDEVEGPGFAFDDEGAGDASIGFKVKLRDERGRSPAIAILAETSVPVGEDGFTSDEFDPSARVSIAHTLSDRLSLGWNVGASLATDVGDDGAEHTLSSALYTVALGIGISDRTGAFIEFFGEAPLSADGGPANSLDGGFTWLFGPNVQLDAFVGVGLSDAADDFFAGMGVSIRLPR